MHFEKSDKMQTWVWMLLIAVLMRRELADLSRALMPEDRCFDAYKTRLTLYQADELHPDFIPKLGMGHITLAGVRHHGLRNFEVWLQSMAPGVATPIHSHPAPCEEINYVLKGSGVVRTRDLTTGELFESPIRENSTVIAPPNTVWMVENNGDELLQVLVVMGCHQPGIDFFPPDGLNSSGSAATDILKVMPWNKQCPPTALESLLGSKIVPG